MNTLFRIFSHESSGIKVGGFGNVRDGKYPILIWLIRRGRWGD
jgi:hypothetical protein